MTTVFTDSAIQAPSKGMQIDTEKLRLYLLTERKEFFERGDEELLAHQFVHGQSNPTYLISIGRKKFVLRKQPPGLLLIGAHDVLREATIIDHLSSHDDIPVAKIYCMCSDSSIVGTPFYIMEHVKGIVYTDPALPSLSPQQRTAVYEAASRVLAAIHSVQIEGSGLERLGSGRNFSARQISIWDGQYKKSSKISGQEVPEMKALAAWLEKNVLSSSPSTDTGGLIKTSAGNYTVIDTAKSRKMCLTHGDFRLDNIVFDTDVPSKILAVLDWELSCVGDPMMDLTYYCIGHHLPAVGILKKVTLLGRGDNNNSNDNNDNSSSSNKSSNSINIPVGIPLERDIATIYSTHSAALTLRDQPTINTDDNTWKFFLALGLFRAASIASGVYARSKQGNASSTGAVAYRDIVCILSTKALEIVRTSSDSSLSSSTSQDIVKNTTESSDPPSIMSREPSEQCRALLKKLKHFNDTVAIPAEQQLIEHYMQAEGKWPNRGSRWVSHPLLEGLITAARRAGLWNLWMPSALAEELKEKHPNWPWALLLPHIALTNTDYAFIAIESGRCLFCAAAINCSAPDTGNMEIIGRFGTQEQRETYLLSLLQGETRSCFAMTEPGVASSDPTQLQSTAVLSTSSRIKVKAKEEEMPSFESIIKGLPTGNNNSSSSGGSSGSSGTSSGSRNKSSDPCSIEKHSNNSREVEEEEEDEDVWVLNGRKWWTTGACHPKCVCCIFVALTGAPQDPPHRRHTLFLFPLTASGVEVLRPLYVMGYDDAPHGHAEVDFKGVRVPPSGILGGLGRGFEVAQSRLGPGRLHHCSRLVGHGERAIEEILKRGRHRIAFGKCLLDLGGNNEKLANCRIILRLAQLSVVEAAVELDRSPVHAARLTNAALQALAVTKVATPKAVQECLDFAVQLHGGGGLSADHPLAAMWSAARTLRIVDGPDEVHLRTLAKLETGNVPRAAPKNVPGPQPGTGKSRL